MLCVCVCVYIYKQTVFCFLYLMYKLNVLKIYDITITSLDMFRQDVAIFRDYVLNLLGC